MVAALKTHHDIEDSSDHKGSVGNIKLDEMDNPLVVKCQTEHPEHPNVTQCCSTQCGSSQNSDEYETAEPILDIADTNLSTGDMYVASSTSSVEPRCHSAQTLSPGKRKPPRTAQELDNCYAAKKIRHIGHADPHCGLLSSHLETSSEESETRMCRCLSESGNSSDDSESVSETPSYTIKESLPKFSNYPAEQVSRCTGASRRDCQSTGRNARRKISTFSGQSVQCSIECVPCCPTTTPLTASLPVSEASISRDLASSIVDENIPMTIVDRTVRSALDSSSLAEVENEEMDETAMIKTSSISVPIKTVPTAEDLRLKLWQEQHLSFALMDNAVNSTLEAMGRLSEQREIVETEGVSQAIQSRGLRRHYSDTGNRLDPLLNSLVVVPEQILNSVIEDNQVTSGSETDGDVLLNFPFLPTAVAPACEPHHDFSHVYDRQSGSDDILEVRRSLHHLSTSRDASQGNDANYRDAGVDLRLADHHPSPKAALTTSSQRESVLDKFKETVPSFSLILDQAIDVVIGEKGLHLD